MTRLAFDLDGWDVRDYRGETPLTEAAIQQHEDTFLNARLWDYRPLGDTLDQLQTVRQYYDFFDVDTDRYQLGDKVRQVMLSVREFALDKNPNADGWVNERLYYTHGIGVAMVPVNEVTPQGQPRPRDPRPAAGLVVGRARRSAEPRIYFGERPASTSSSTPAGRVRLPARAAMPRAATSSTTAGTGQDRHQARHDALAAPVRAPLPRLQPADQRPDHEPEPAPVPPVARRSAAADRAVPALRQGPVRRHRRGGRADLHPGRLHDERSLPERPGVRSRRPAARPASATATFNYLRNSVKVVMDAYDGTMTFYVSDPDDPLIRAWQGVFPTLFKPMSEFPADLRPHLRVPEELFNVQTRMYGRYHVTDPQTFYSENDLWTVPTGQTSDAEPPERGLLRDHVAARGEQPRVPAPPADDPERAAEHDRVGRRPERWRRLRPDARLSLPEPRRPSSGPAQIEAQIDVRPGDQRPVHAVEPVRQHGDPGQPDRRARRGLAHLPPAGVPPVDQREVPGLPEDHRGLADDDRLGRHAPARPSTSSCASRARRPGPSPSPGPTPTPGPSATPGPSGDARHQPTPPAGDVQALVGLRQPALRARPAGPPRRRLRPYGEEIALVQQALGQLEQLTGGSPSPSSAP